MAVHSPRKIWPQKVWLSALGLLTALLWTAQFAADWYVPKNDIGIAQLDRIELAHVSPKERTDSSRAWRLESKPDPAATTAGQYAADAFRTDRFPSTLSAVSAHHQLAVALPGIRAPPHYFFSA